MTTETRKPYGVVQHVDLSKVEIHPDVKNVRLKVLKADCRELMNSIRERGIQNPITCFFLEDKTFLVSGERRLASMRWLREEDPKDPDFRTIPVLYKDYGKDPKQIITDALYDNFIENVQRRNLNGYDMAMRLAFLIKEKGKKKSDLVKEIGKSLTWINEVLKFLDADPEVQRAVRDGDLSLDEGKKVAKLKSKEVQAKVATGLAAAKTEAKAGGEKGKKGRAAVRAVKAKMDATTRPLSHPAAKKMDIRRTKNTVFVILEEMSKAKHKNTKAFLMYSGFLNALNFVLGVTPALATDKFLKKYKVDVGADGKRVFPKSPKKKPRQTDIEDKKKKGKKPAVKKSAAKKKAGKKK